VLCVHRIAKSCDFSAIIRRRFRWLREGNFSSYTSSLLPLEIQ
jgi:hypothetical protein